MKKLIAIVMMLLSILLVGCGDKQPADALKDSPDDGEPLFARESSFVKNAKAALSEQLEYRFKRGTKAEDMKVAYESEKDSICVIDFVNVYPLASGRELRGRYEFVYYPQSELLGGFFINLEDEKSIIEQSKDWLDELEKKSTPEERETLKGWESSLPYVVMIRCVKEETEAIGQMYK